MENIKTICSNCSCEKTCRYKTCYVDILEILNRTFHSLNDKNKNDFIIFNDPSCKYYKSNRPIYLEIPNFMSSER